MTVVLRTCLICGWARLGIGRELAVSMRNELRSDRRKNNQEPNFSRQEWRFVPIHLPAHLDSFVSSFSGTICGYKMDSGRVTNYKNRIRAPGFIVDSTLNRCGDAIFSIPLLRHSVELALNTIQRWCCSKFGQNRSCTSYTEWYEINSSYFAFVFACLHVHSHQVPSVSFWIVFCYLLLRHARAMSASSARGEKIAFVHARAMPASSARGEKIAFVLAM